MAARKKIPPSHWKLLAVVGVWPHLQGLGLKVEDERRLEVGEIAQASQEARNLERNCSVDSTLVLFKFGH